MSHIIHFPAQKPNRSLGGLAVPEKIASPDEMLAAAERARDRMAVVTELIESVLHRLAEH
jgi:hypothetical protein